MAALGTTVRGTIHKPTKEELQLPAPTMLPPGPGNNWTDAAFRSQHHKSHVLAAEFAGMAPSEYKPTYIRPREDPPTLNSGSANHLQTALLASQRKETASLLPPQPESLDGKVLRFYAYRVETVPESSERMRVRLVTICVHLQDNTVSINEPNIHNSGLQGGTILKRQRVESSLSEPTSKATALTWEQFNVGAEVNICGAVYRMYDCDAFTRDTLRSNGVQVPDSFEPPEDPTIAAMRARAQKRPPSFEHRDLAITCEQLAAGGKNVGARYPDDIQRVQRFIHDSGKMLKFNAYWIDEETNLVRTLEIRYFVEDDTIAVVESVSTGDAISKSFLSRRRVPKKGTTSRGCDMTFSGRVNGSREVYLGDEDSYYEKSDFELGMAFNLYGRKLVVYDCDACTRDYYRTELGRELKPSIDISHLFPKKVVPKLPIPPPTGFGSPEDSRASCKKLVLCPPKQPPPKEDFDCRSLRFQLKFYKPDRHEDTMRSFILTYYLEDDEIMISECALRNTGFTGGKFINKQRLRKDPDSEDPDNFFKLEEITIGAVLNITGHKFEVTAIDKNSAEWIATHEGSSGKPLDPHQNDQVSSERLQALLSAFQQFTICRFCTQTEAFRFFDKDRDGKVTLGELLDGLKSSQLTRRESEAVAMMNFIDQSQNGFINYKDFFAAVTNPMLVHETKHIHDVSEHKDHAKGITQDSQAATLRNRTLKALKERLEGRCLNVFEMFRLLSTMPRAYRGRRADMSTLTNTAKDTVFTPVQLRRGVTEHLGMRLSDAEMAALLGFFFPSLPESEYGVMADGTFRHTVDLKTFQAKFSEMELVGQLH